MNLDLQRTTLTVNGRFACLMLKGTKGTEGCIRAGRERDADRLAASKPPFGHVFVPLEAALRGKEKILPHGH